MKTSIMHDFTITIQKTSNAIQLLRSDIQTKRAYFPLPSNTRYNSSFLSENTGLDARLVSTRIKNRANGFAASWCCPSGDREIATRKRTANSRRHAFRLGSSFVRPSRNFCRSISLIALFMSFGGPATSDVPRRPPFTVAVVFLEAKFNFCLGGFSFMRSWRFFG